MITIDKLTQSQRHVALKIVDWWKGAQALPLVRPPLPLICGPAECGKSTSAKAAALVIVEEVLKRQAGNIPYSIQTIKVNQWRPSLFHVECPTLKWIKESVTPEILDPGSLVLHPLSVVILEDVHLLDQRKWQGMDPGEEDEARREILLFLQNYTRVTSGLRDPGISSLPTEPLLDVPLEIPRPFMVIATSTCPEAAGERCASNTLCWFDGVEHVHPAEKAPLTRAWRVPLPAPTRHELEQICRHMLQGRATQGLLPRMSEFVGRAAGSPFPIPVLEYQVFRSTVRHISNRPADAV